MTVAKSIGLTALMLAGSLLALIANDGVPTSSQAAAPLLIDHKAVIIGLFVLPAALMVICLVFGVVRGELGSSGALQRVVVPYSVIERTVLGLIIVLHAALLAAAFGAQLDLARVAVIGSGILLVIIGNYLPKIRYNSAVGVLTPWNLGDERVWDRTHRTAGLLLFGAGLFALVGGVLSQSRLGLLASLILPTILAIAGIVGCSAFLGTSARHAS